MHRTGTSAVTRVLALLGADLPGTMGPNAADNEPGFWEPLEIVQAHARLLAAAGSAWDDVSPIGEEWLASPEARRYEDQLLQLLESNYGSSPLFVLKDPRICRLIPLWLRVFERFGADPLFVITVRNPLEVAASLRVRDGLSTQRSQLLWLRHVLEAERFSRGHARSFVSYERLLLDWIPVAEQVATDLGLSWPRVNHTVRAEVDRFLSPAHRHHVITDEETRRLLPPVKRLYDLLVAAAGARPLQLLPDNKLILDGMYRELGEHDLTYGPLLAEERVVAREQVVQARAEVADELAQLREELERRTRAEADGHRQIRDLTEQAAALSAETEALRRAVSDGAQALEENQREAAEHHRRLEAALQESEQALVISAAEVQTLAGRLLELEQERLEDQAELAARRQAAAAAQRRVEVLSRRAAELDHRAGRLAGRAARLEGERSEIEASARSLEEAAERSAEVEQELRRELARQAEALTAGERRTRALTDDIKRAQFELLELRARLDDAARALAEQQQVAAASQHRLGAELTERGRQLARSEGTAQILSDRVATLQAELSLKTRTLRSVQGELTVVRAQLEARLLVRIRLGTRQLKVTAGTLMLRVAAFARRWSKVGNWLLRQDTRPLALAYLGLRDSGAFDPEFYLANYRDVARSGLEPLLHYIQYGVRDRYDPNRGFSTAAYLAAHPELEATGMNPLLHALRAGVDVTTVPALPAAPGLPAPQAEREQTLQSPIGATEESAAPPPELSIAPTEPAAAVAAQSLANGGSGTAALAAIPRGAVVILVSDDPEFRPPELTGHRVWHLPQISGDGEATGASSERAEIEALRAKGAGFLVVAGQARASLARAPELRDYLNTRYSCLADTGEVTLYELTAHRVRQPRRRSVRMPGSGGLDVICMPIIDWNYRFQRPQQLMTQFSSRGHRVFYLATTFHRETRRPAISPLAENVWGVRLPGRPEVNIYTDAVSEEILDTAIEGLAAVRRSAHIGPAVVVVDLPFWGPIALESRERWGYRVIYDCMDEHGGFVVAEDGGEELRQKIDIQERVLLSDSDLVLATSRALYEKADSISKKVLLVPNAADFEHFSQAGQGPLPPSLPRPVIGYYGAIASWFDSALVGDAARQNPEWSFVLAGRTTGADLTPLEGLANVHLLGELPYEAVPSLLHQFDVACIPFHLIDLTLATNPVKFYEYMSAGKPVVSVALPELEPYDGYFYPASSSQEFVSQIERALQEDSEELRRRRIALGQENTWTDRYRALSSAIRPWYPKAAIVITSFNNPEYLRQCLDSLREKTDYPNFEVIVVDNGSDQSLVDEVAARSEHDPNLRLIAQGENLGFARANNIGIEAADDADYVVLLNDDTVVTPGWLGRLVGHLQDDTIGLVGPVSNWAGNEARIDVPYSEDLAGLDEFAARRSEEHRGQVFDLPVLAMYCVACAKSFMDQLGRLDERFRIGMFEDDDFAMRVREAGKRVVCAEDVFIHHWGRASFRRMSETEYESLFEENKRVYEGIWNRRWVPHRERER